MNRHAPSFLVIEDNPGDFVLVEDFLLEQFASPEISHAADCRQAIAKLRETERPFDVILLDLTLPDRSGEPLIQAIVEACGAAPVIVLTGYADIQFGARSLSLGIADYVLKDELTPLTLYKSVIYSWERQRYVAELAASEKNYSELFQLSPQPMWVFDLDTLAFLDVNEAAMISYGYSRDEFLSMTVFDIRPAEEVPRVKQSLADFRSGKEMIQRGIFLHQKRNGNVIHVDAQTNPINFQGRTAMVVTTNDITERMQYIKAIEDQNEKLKEISWMQSHIIRAPLSRIMGLIPLIIMLKEEKAEERAELCQMLDFLEISANELDQVIRNITDKSNEGRVAQ